jgi:hypothetical protein
MTSDVVMALEPGIQKLAVSLRDVVEWQWDTRFKTAMAEFPIERKEDILSILDEHLIVTWDLSNIQEAPEVVRELVKRLGGLMSGQLLLLTDPEEPAFLFCAWWPWGNGKTVSIRIAPFGRDLVDADASRLLAVFRGWFGI